MCVSFYAACVVLSSATATATAAATTKTATIKSNKNLVCRAFGTLSRASCVVRSVRVDLTSRIKRAGGSDGCDGGGGVAFKSGTRKALKIM